MSSSSRPQSRTNVVPSNERPSFLPGYPYRINPVILGGQSGQPQQQQQPQQRPSSAGTSRSRGNSNRTADNSNNIYISGAYGATADTTAANQYLHLGGSAVPTQRPSSSYNSSNNTGSRQTAPFMNITSPHLYVSSNGAQAQGVNQPAGGFNQQYMGGSNKTSNTQGQPMNMFPMFQNQPAGNTATSSSSASSASPKSAGATRGYDFPVNGMNNINAYFGNVKQNTANNQTAGYGISLPSANPVPSNSNVPPNNWQSYKLNFDGSNGPVVEKVAQSNNVGASENMKPNTNFAPVANPTISRPTSAIKIRQAVVDSYKYNVQENAQVDQSQGPRPPDATAAPSASNPRTLVHNVVVQETVHTIPKVTVTTAQNDAEPDEEGDMGLDAAEVYDGANKKAANTAAEEEDDEMDGRPIQASRSQPEISIITASQSLDYGNVGSIGNGPIDVRNSSIDSFAENDIDIGLSTVPNQFCTKRDALELRKLVMMTSQSRGGIVPSSSAVMDMYMVGKVIGVGSYGKVRAAWHRLTGSKIAIKTYDKAKMKDPSHWKRIYSEIKIMEQISHPRIARLFEAVETPKRMHLIMECSDGGNLCSYVKQKKRLSEEESKRIFFHIVQAIDYLHSLGVAHRDIKLENVLFTENRDIKLIDFGFSTVCQPGKKLKVFCGTPSYMAPEIVNRLEYEGIPVDMWSLGILLYALLCGCFPFRAKTYPDLYRRIARGTFAIPDELSSQAKDLIRQLLTADVSHRMTSQAALKHPWLQSQFSGAPDMDKMRKETPILISDRASDDIDEETLQEIERYGIVKEELVKTVLTKTHSAIATLYYLLLDIIIAKRKKSGSGKRGYSTGSNKSYQIQNNYNMYANQQTNFHYNPAYVLNHQENNNQPQQPQVQHINMNPFQGADTTARPRSASATRSSGSSQRPLSASATRR